jgi:hypothetical protein
LKAIKIHISMQMVCCQDLIITQSITEDSQSHAEDELFHTKSGSYLCVSLCQLCEPQCQFLSYIKSISEPWKN